MTKKRIQFIALGSLAASGLLLDGREILRRIDGRPLADDPGLHHFKFSVVGFPAIEQDHVIVAGGGSSSAANIVVAKYSN